VTEAIDSALNQTYRDFEVIVIDDGSTDGTGEMLKERYDDKIRYFYKENGGCASARNYGIKMARGEYIAFLDSDDRYLSFNISPVPSVEPSSITITSKSLYVWFNALSIASVTKSLRLYAGMMTLTFGLFSICPLL
jgi:glycosyltransferase involved in cell wall biosynthesis